MIATTLNIHIDVLSQIAEAAEKYKKSRKEIIVLLLLRLMNDLKSYRHRFDTVRYQQDDIKVKWRCFHIRLREVDYEYFVDLRKLCKFSVSCLVALAVKKYLHRLMDDVDNKNVDNYIHSIDFELVKRLLTAINHKIYTNKTRKST